LRIDFPRYPPAGEGFLLVGEALGLVNPVTGEGTEYSDPQGKI
jgi:flavin-dependent dehydrogenase